TVELSPNARTRPHLSHRAAISKQGWFTPRGGGPQSLCALQVGPLGHQHVRFIRLPAIANTEIDRFRALLKNLLQLRLIAMAENADRAEVASIGRELPLLRVEAGGRNS